MTKLIIYLVPHGYQIDLKNSERNKSYKKEIFFECRDYGNNIDVEESIDKIIEFVKKIR